MKVPKLICFHILHENLSSVYLFVLMEEESEAHTRQLLSSGKVWKPQVQASAKISVYTKQKQRRPGGYSSLVVFICGER